jgi:hypothetical protein
MTWNAEVCPEGARECNPQTVTYASSATERGTGVKIVHKAQGAQAVTVLIAQIAVVDNLNRNLTVYTIRSTDWWNLFQRWLGMHHLVPNPETDLVVDQKPDKAIPSLGAATTVEMALGPGRIAEVAIEIKEIDSNREVVHSQKTDGARGS